MISNLILTITNVKPQYPSHIYSAKLSKCLYWRHPACMTAYKWRGRLPARMMAMSCRISTRLWLILMFVGGRYTQTMAQAFPAQISREQVSTLMRSKKHFYRAMQQAGYLLPAERQAIISIKFMHEVRSGWIYMPRAAAATSACPMVAYPPTNDMLVELVVQAAPRAVLARPEDLPAQPVTKLIKRVRKRGADKAWLLQLLHCFDPESEVFRKSYRYIRPRDERQPDRLQIYNNADGFFSDLPPLRPSELRGRQMRLAKKDKQMLHMRAYEERLADLQARMERLRNQMGEAEDAEPAAQQHPAAQQYPAAQHDPGAQQELDEAAREQQEAQVA